MEKFFSLPVEKQNNIINAGLIVFGTNGYKKASIRDIATAAGISKSMIFHYFGTKKELYLFLANFSASTLMNEIKKCFNESNMDFFERIRLIAEIELLVMKQHPAIFSFLKSIYFETDEEVAEEIKAMMSQGEDLRLYIALTGTDISKFKEGIDPALVMKIISYFTEGYIAQLGNKAEIDMDVMMKEFYQCVDLLKQNFYKEEFV